MTFQVGVIIGSLRKASFSRRVADAMGELAPPGLAMIEISFGDLALYNADLEPETPPTLFD